MHQSIHTYSFITAPLNNLLLMLWNQGIMGFLHIFRGSSECSGATTSKVVLGWSWTWAENESHSLEREDKLYYLTTLFFNLAYIYITERSPYYFNISLMLVVFSITPTWDHKPAGLPVVVFLLKTPHQSRKSLSTCVGATCMQILLYQQHQCRLTRVTLAVCAELSDIWWSYLCHLTKMHHLIGHQRTKNCEVCKDSPSFCHFLIPIVVFYHSCGWVSFCFISDAVTNSNGLGT